MLHWYFEDRIAFGHSLTDKELASLENKGCQTFVVCDMIDIPFCPKKTFFIQFNKQNLPNIQFLKMFHKVFLSLYSSSVAICFVGKNSLIRQAILISCLIPLINGINPCVIANSFAEMFDINFNQEHMEFMRNTLSDQA